MTTPILERRLGYRGKTGRKEVKQNGMRLFSGASCFLLSTHCRGFALVFHPLVRGDFQLNSLADFGVRLPPNDFALVHGSSAQVRRGVEFHPHRGNRFSPHHRCFSGEGVEKLQGIVAQRFTSREVSNDEFLKVPKNEKGKS